MKLTLRTLRSSRPLRELIGLLLLVLALVSLLALLSYTHGDATWFKRQPQDVPTRNWIGRAGATLAEAYLQLVGAAAFGLPLVLGLVGWERIRPARSRASYLRLAGHVALGLALLALLDLLYGEIVYGGDRFRAGGYLGLRLADQLRALGNKTGAFFVSATAVIALLMALTRLSPSRAGELALRAGRATADAVRGAWSRARAARPPVRRPAAGGAADEGRAGAGAAGAHPRPPIRLDGGPESAGAAAAEVAPPALDPGPARPAARGAPPRRPRQRPLPIEEGRRGYSLPPIDLLHEPEPQSGEDERALLERARQITEKFREFSIDGSVVAIHPGPVVTTFEFKPDAGVKYSKITGMTDDLSLALKAESVRIDRMPGRSTVGIEVPNRRQETIFPRELIGSERFRASRSKLRLALGKDIHGDVHVAELDRMPHLLIAGATGAGKSVGLNGMIVSLLYTSTPENLRFIMIDTKMIELGIYADIPHLLIPVVTEPKQASTALKWAVREMEMRYRKLAAVGVRNIAQYNALIADEPGRKMEDPRGGEAVPLEQMAYIVIVIDEMADLMMVSSADVEESVMRLAQMARAVGIHLILATQRPSVDVITGTIKANFPSRIAFRVSQRVDSRTIIDQQGAEHLLGRGDMLFLPTGSARVVRLHSGFITEPEINGIVSYLKKMAAPVYDPSVLADPEEARPGYENGERDEMFMEAVRTVLNEGKCSITLIQRRLQLGYARAARIVDMMEREGVVSMGEGSKPREVLVGPEILEALEARQ